MELKWEPYSTWNKVDMWYDVIFSDVDIIVTPGETLTINFQLKCP